MRMRRMRGRGCLIGLEWKSAWFMGTDSVSFEGEGYVFVLVGRVGGDIYGQGKIF
jgi:hypothetical protein